jgi:hypothetical protein
MQQNNKRKLLQVDGLLGGGAADDVLPRTPTTLFPQGGIVDDAAETPAPEIVVTVSSGTSTDYRLG